MRIVASRANPTEIKADVLALPVFEGTSPTEGLPGQLNHITQGKIASAFERGEFTGERDQWTLFHPTREGGPGRVLLYGLGKPRELDFVFVERTAGSVVRILMEREVRSLAIALPPALGRTSFVQAIGEGALLASLRSERYQTEPRVGEIETCAILSSVLSEAELEAAVSRGSILGEATNLARSLAFDPSNILTPDELSSRAAKTAADFGLSCEVLGEEEMKALGMGALLAVSRGSQEPARLIVMSYEASGIPADSELIALIGKGITFDSGGISIKPAEKMEEMKYDMGGGAAVIGAMQAIARLRPAARVLGVVPASENLPSGRALKPGDVLRSLSGKTIEVANTDAEGRLVLCDAITYSINRGADTIIDAATLTGAVVVALGEARAGVMGNDQDLLDQLIEAGERCGERVWPLPMDREYDDLIKSDIADVRNIGNRTAGAITGGWFLRRFVGDRRWAHLDIAGTAWTEEAKPYLARGATGFGTRLMATVVLDRAKRGQRQPD
jgi:leucyl aminopeptidase